MPKNMLCVEVVDNSDSMCVSASASMLLLLLLLPVLLLLVLGVSWE